MRVRVTRPCYWDAARGALSCVARGPACAMPVLFSLVSRCITLFGALHELKLIYFWRVPTLCLCSWCWQYRCHRKWVAKVNRFAFWSEGNPVNLHWLQQFRRFRRTVLTRTLSRSRLRGTPLTHLASDPSCGFQNIMGKFARSTWDRASTAWIRVTFVQFLSHKVIQHNNTPLLLDADLNEGSRVVYFW